MWFGRKRREAEQQLEAARREHWALSERVARSEAELAGAWAELETVTSERDAVAGQLAVLTAERDELRTVVDHYRTTPSPTGTPEGCWALLLADLARRWPAPVGATPGASGTDPAAVVTGTMPEQLAEAISRELERLREDVGVDAEVSVSGTIAPTDPVVFLLATLDLLGALTASCQGVVVKLENQLDLVGEGWEGQRDDLDSARSRALTAGAVVSPFEIDDDQVRVSLIPSPAD